MNNIVGILDLDGYTINKKFLCREPTIIKADQYTGTSYHFDIGIRWGDLTLKDRKSCMYRVKKCYVHAYTRGTTFLRILHEKMTVGLSTRKDPSHEKKYMI